MALSTPDNGTMESEMASETKCGLMVRAMRVTGKQTKRTGKASLFMPMETFMKDSGSMTRHTEKALTHMPTALIITEIGSTTSSTASAWSHGQMVPNMRAIT